MLQPRSRRYGGSTGKGRKTTHAKKTKSKKQQETMTTTRRTIQWTMRLVPPTVVDFTLAYDTAIQGSSLSSSSPTNAPSPALQSVHRVVSVSELEPVDCNETQTTFDTNVFLKCRHGQRRRKEKEGASFSRIAALEQGFRQTYNALNAFNPNTCDLLFRQVELAGIVNTDAAL